MRCLIALLAVLLLLTGVPASAHAQEPAEGIINGQVINGTEDGGSVAGVEVMLITYVNDTLADTTTAKTDDEGNFQFDGVNLEYEYIVTTRYMGVDYYYPVEFEAGAATAYVLVGVCDATDSDAAIRVGQAHKIVNIEEEGLLVTEVYWLVNDGDKTYVRANGVLDFTLPEGAFAFEAPEQLMIDFQLLGGNMVTYLVPFPPGEREIVYSYRLTKPDTAEYSIPLMVDYPTDSLELMVAGENIEVAVSQLAPADPVVASTGERYIHFQGKSLPRNTMINLYLSDLSGGGFPLYILWVIIGVVVLGLAIYLIRRRQKVGSHE